MKNLLQLQIKEAIQKANSFFISSRLTHASAACDTAFQIFYQNVAYNQSIRSNYQCLLCSLKGAICEEIGQEQAALSNYNKALILTPNHVPTLLRRGRVFLRVFLRIKQKKLLMDAMEDVEKAMFEYPESIEIGDLAEKVKIQILKLEDQSERNTFLESYKKKFQREFEKDRQQQIFDEESRMSFSHLKQIDKESTEKQFKRKSTRAYSQLLVDDQEVCLQKSTKIKGRKGSWMPQIIQKRNNFRKTYSNESDNSCDTFEKPISKFKSSDINVSNFKNTDNEKQGKLREFQSVLSKRNSEVKFKEDLQNGPIQVEKKKGKRRSCLRVSSMSENTEKLGFTPLRESRNSFGGLKCIDRKMSKNSECSEKEFSSQKQEKERLEEGESEEDEKNEHNIFEGEVSGRQILRCLNNLTKLSSEKKEDGPVKKKSILRKNSIADSASSRKSVTFKIDSHQ